MTEKMKWVLFWVFTVLFVVIVIATVLTVFYGIGQLQDYERKALFYAFIMEIATTIGLLVKWIFSKCPPLKVRLNLTDKDGGMIDLRKYDGQKAKCDLRYRGEKINVNPLECDMEYRGMEEGLVIFPDFPPETEFVRVTINIEKDNEQFSGYFNPKDFKADLRRGG